MANRQSPEAVAQRRHAYYLKHREEKIQEAKEYYQAHREEKLAYQQAYRDSNRLAARAHSAYWNARTSGKLSPPNKPSCHYCQQPATDAHHPSYHHPLKFLHLCRSCHTSLHKNHPNLEKELTQSMIYVLSANG